MCQRGGHRVADREVTVSEAGELADLAKALGRILTVLAAERQDDHRPGLYQPHEQRDVPLLGQCGQRRGQAGRRNPDVASLGVDLGDQLGGTHLPVRVRQQRGAVVHDGDVVHAARPRARSSSRCASTNAAWGIDGASRRRHRCRAASVTSKPAARSTSSSVGSVTAARRAPGPSPDAPPLATSPF
jgi:hypothetical protein